MLFLFFLDSEILYNMTLVFHYRVKRLYMATHMMQRTKGSYQTHDNTYDTNFKQFSSNLFFLCRSERVNLCFSLSSCFHSEILQPCESIQKLFKTNWKDRKKILIKSCFSGCHLAQEVFHLLRTKALSRTATSIWPDQPRPLNKKNNGPTNWSEHTAVCSNMTVRCKYKQLHFIQLNAFHRY